MSFLGLFHSLYMFLNTIIAIQCEANRALSSFEFFSCVDMTSIGIRSFYSPFILR